jgi:hypothetical protein
MSVYYRHRGGIYYLSETDSPRHRAKVCTRELESYDAINKHFKGTYEPFLLSLSNSVFWDIFRYDAERAGKDGCEPLLAKLSAAYPAFAQHFLRSLKVGTK